MHTSCARVLRRWPGCDIDDATWAERPKLNNYHMVYMMYPYYYIMKALMFDNNKALAHATSWSLPLDLARTPVLFIYGNAKSVMLHDRRSLAILEKEEREGRSGCRVVGIEGAGHWMYCQRPDVCEHEIRKFLKCGHDKPLRDDDGDIDMTTPRSRL